MAANYTNRELDQLFKTADLRSESFHSKLMQRMDDFEEATKDALDRIEEQTKKTNGYVANLKMWRAYMVGAIAVISFFLASVAVPVLSSFIQAGKI